MNAVLRTVSPGKRRFPSAERKEPGWIRKLWPWLANHKGDVFLAFGVAIVGMVIAALTPVVEKVLLDDVVLHHRKSLWP